MGVIQSIAGIIWIIVMIGGGIGYVGNLFEVIVMTVDWTQTDDAFRVLGIVFPPLGPLMWWFF